MPPLAPVYDLSIEAGEATGEHSPGLDLAACAALAQTLARNAQTWAAESRWTGLGGFDASGGFWLAPLYGQRLGFVRAPRCEGWLRLTATDPLAAHFPLATEDPDGGGPLSLASLHPRLRALVGFGGCTLFQPATGQWEPLVEAPDPARLAASARNVTPLLRTLATHGLPFGRLLLTSNRFAALLWRTPAQAYGYLQLHELEALADATTLVDLLLLGTAASAPL